MKTQNTPDLSAPPRRLGLVSALLATALAVAAPARAADWYLRLTQPHPENWSAASYWNTAALGTGTNAVAISSSDVYHANGKTVRTPYAAAPQTFPGGVLRLSGDASVLAIKTTGAAGTTIAKLESIGGKIENAEAGTVYLNVSHFNNLSGTTTLSSATGRATKLAIGTLLGSGEFLVSGSGSSAILQVAEGRGYVGQLRVASGTLDFDSDTSFSGPLVIEGGKVTLDQNITVTALKINGASYPAGSHLYSDLSTGAHAAYFNAGGSGSITVKPPVAWYLAPADQQSPNHWETYTDWTDSPAGTGANPTEFRAADTFDTNGKAVLRAPFTGLTPDNTAFGGGRLSLTAPTVLAIKASNDVFLHHVPDLLTTNGKISQNTNALVRLRIERWENASTSASGLVFESYHGTNSGMRISVGKLTGAGKTSFSTINGGNAKYHLTIDDAGSYLGDLILARGTLNFENDLRSAGRLVIQPGNYVELNRTVEFGGLVIDGVKLPDGTHTLAGLQLAYPGRFLGSGGSIVVGESRNWYLTTSQAAATDNWDKLLHWSSAADGTGPSPASINMIDNYVNQASARTLRTTDATTTFGGGALVLASGARLHLRAPAGQVTTIPALDTSGGAMIANGVTTTAQTLVVSDWNLGPGNTNISVPGTETLTVTVDELSGTGTLLSQTGGNYRYSIHHANKFTGTIQHYSGVLTFDSQIGTNGPLVVDSGAKLILNKPGFFTSIKLGSVYLAPGFHSYGSLRANYAAYFPAGGSPDAFLAVHAPDLTGPVPMLGLNIAGGDFTPNIIPGRLGWEYMYPSEARVQYAHSKGVKLIRIPFRWERIQRTLEGDLWQADMTALDTSIGYATARGMKVVLDMHNYARRKPTSSTEVIIGTGSVSYASFADVWRKLADRYKNNSTIWAYGIMNEPHDLSNWSTIAQTAINAIREKDLTHHVLVGGNGWSNARNWTSHNRDLVVDDPVGRMIYEAHCYFDSNNDGVYNSYEAEGGSPTLGVERVKEFVEWLQARGARGFVGEYGVPYNEPRWLDTLDNFLAYLQANGVSGTYWATGPWPTSDLINCEPSTSGVDRPQMAIIDDYVATP